MHYCSDISLAFYSIEHIMRDVNYGWMLRYAHSNGASFFFIVVYLHIARSLYYIRYDFLFVSIWSTGLSIFFLMMGTAFIGYVLPWGQMSFWGATVITNLLSAIPVSGIYIVMWLWGGFSVGGPTLSRFFSLHYIFPFLIVGVVFFHLFYLHIKGSSNPSFISPEVNRSYIPLYPYFVVKDGVGLFFYFTIYFIFICFFPDFLGHSDNYIPADPMKTPEHIVPEWYFLPFYAILRSIPDKLWGVIAMLFSILIFFFLPFFSYVLYKLGISYFKFPVFNLYIYPFFIFLFYNIFFLLGWIGSQPVEYPFIEIGFLLFKFFFFFVIYNSFFLSLLLIYFNLNYYV